MAADKANAEFSKISNITELLAEYASNPAKPNQSLIGDDAAIIAFDNGNPYLFASDLLVENVHFRTSYFTPEQLGSKAIAVNVSDMAAMGGHPLFATISLACPKGFDILGFYRGVRTECSHYRMRVAGGDLSSSDLIFVSVALVGRPFAEPITRDGAKAGDAVFVTGTLGGSAAGLRQLLGDPSSDTSLTKLHKHPIARTEEARILSMLKASSAIDISDGLASDLGHICTSSGVGARIHTVPIEPGASQDNALFGGEDYELLFTHPDPKEVVAMFTTYKLRTPFHIGEILDGNGVYLDGATLPAMGFEHDI